MRTVRIPLHFSFNRLGQSIINIDEAVRNTCFNFARSPRSSGYAQFLATQFFIPLLTGIIPISRETISLVQNTLELAGKISSVNIVGPPEVRMINRGRNGEFEKGRLYLKSLRGTKNDRPNEDSLVVVETILNETLTEKTFAVLDGAGGMGGGLEASSIGSEALIIPFAQRKSLIESATTASKAIRQGQRIDPKLAAMTATLSAVRIIERNGIFDSATICSIGDSPVLCTKQDGSVYLLNHVDCWGFETWHIDNYQKSFPIKLTEKVLKSIIKSPFPFYVLSRSLGNIDHTSIAEKSLPLERGDTLILASDFVSFRLLLESLDIFKAPNLTNKAKANMLLHIANNLYQGKTDDGSMIWYTLP